MNLGGTEKALLNLLDTINLEQNDITILMLEKFGDLLNEIPKNVSVKYVEGYSEAKEIINNSPKAVIRGFVKKKKLGKAFCIGKQYIISKCKGERSNLYRSIFKNIEILDEEFDIAVAYAGPHELITYIIQDKIKAKEKYQWIHFDVSKIYLNKKFSEKYFSKFNKIITVSGQAKENLLEQLPILKEKVVVRYNDIPIEKIKRKAEQGIGFTDNFDGVRILTVGRMTYEKGYDLAINACKLLIDDGLNVKWYCIGDGNQLNNCKQLVKDLDIENNVVFLGSKKNPYTYMKECDIYVQPSRHEGFCITLGEAKIFNKPIITTNFVGAKEQLKNLNYKIVDFDINAIASSILKLSRV